LILPIKSKVMAFIHKTFLRAENFRFIYSQAKANSKEGLVIGIHRWKLGEMVVGVYILSTNSLRFTEDGKTLKRNTLQKIKEQVVRHD